MNQAAHSFHLKPEDWKRTHDRVGTTIGHFHFLCYTFLSFHNLQSHF